MLLLVLGIVPILNILILIGAIIILVMWAFEKKIELKDTRINRFLKN